MAEVVHFVVLAVLSVIGVGNCGNLEPLCNEKPFWDEKCVSDPNSQDRSAEEITCMFESSGIVSKNGEIDADKFHELMQPHVVEGRQELADTYIEVVRKCAKEGGSGKTPENALIGLFTCGGYVKQRKQYAAALCADISL